MFEQEMLSFYRKYVQFQKHGATCKCVIPMKDKIQFVFYKDECRDAIEYTMVTMSSDVIKMHNKNIRELYVLCTNKTNVGEKIYYNYCAHCGKMYMSDRIIENAALSRCQQCNKEFINKSIGSSFDGKQSFVYLICNATSKMLKIGFSSKPDYRLKALQTGNSDNLYIYSVIEGGQKLEKNLHSVFSNYRVKGEWFEYSEDIFNYFDNYRL